MSTKTTTEICTLFWPYIRDEDPTIFLRRGDSASAENSLPAKTVIGGEAGYAWIVGWTLTGLNVVIATFLKDVSLTEALQHVEVLRKFGFTCMRGQPQETPLGHAAYSSGEEKIYSEDSSRSPLGKPPLNAPKGEETREKATTGISSAAPTRASPQPVEDPSMRLLCHPQFRNIPHTLAPHLYLLSSLQVLGIIYTRKFDPVRFDPGGNASDRATPALSQALQNDPCLTDYRLRTQRDIWLELDYQPHACAPSCAGPSLREVLCSGYRLVHCQLHVFRCDQRLLLSQKTVPETANALYGGLETLKKLLDGERPIAVPGAQSTVEGVVLPVHMLNECAPRKSTQNSSKLGVFKTGGTSVLPCGLMDSYKNAQLKQQGKRNDFSNAQTRCKQHKVSCAKREKNDKAHGKMRTTVAASVPLILTAEEHILEEQARETKILDLKRALDSNYLEVDPQLLNVMRSKQEDAGPLVEANLSRETGKASARYVEGIDPRSSGPTGGAFTDSLCNSLPNRSSYASVPDDLHLLSHPSTLPVDPLAAADISSADAIYGGYLKKNQKKEIGYRGPQQELSALKDGAHLATSTPHVIPRSSEGLGNHPSAVQSSLLSLSSFDCSSSSDLVSEMSGSFDSVLYMGKKCESDFGANELWKVVDEETEGEGVLTRSNSPQKDSGGISINRVPRSVAEGATGSGNGQASGAGSSNRVVPPRLTFPLSLDESEFSTMLLLSHVGSAAALLLLPPHTRKGEMDTALSCCTNTVQLSSDDSPSSPQKISSHFFCTFSMLKTLKFISALSSSLQKLVRFILRILLILHPFSYMVQVMELQLRESLHVLSLLSADLEDAISHLGDVHFSTPDSTVSKEEEEKRKRIARASLLRGRASFSLCSLPLNQVSCYRSSQHFCGLHPVMPHRKSCCTCFRCPYCTSSSSPSFLAKVKCILGIIFPVWDQCRMNYFARVMVGATLSILLYLILFLNKSFFLAKFSALSHYFLIDIHLNYLQWFETWPAGLKLNEDLCLVIGFVAQTLIEGWDMLMRIPFALLSHQKGDSDLPLCFAIHSSQLRNMTELPPPWPSSVSRKLEYCPHKPIVPSLFRGSLECDAYEGRYFLQRKEPASTVFISYFLSGPSSSTACHTLDAPVELFDYFWVSVGYNALIKSSLFGASCAVAWIADVTVYVSLHLRLMHHVTAALFVYTKRAIKRLYAQLCGHSFNPLRNRAVPFEFDREQLLAAVMIFTVLIFLFPTIAVYYFYFSIVRISVWVAQEGLSACAHISCRMPLYSLVHWCVQHCKTSQPEVPPIPLVSPSAVNPSRMVWNDCSALRPAGGGGIVVHRPVITQRWTVEMEVHPVSLPFSRSLIVDFYLVMSYLLSPFTSTKTIRRIFEGEEDVSLDHLSALISHLLESPENPECVLPNRVKS